MPRRPPAGLLKAAREDPTSRAVLTDWYEENDQSAWARWIRDTATGKTRARLLDLSMRRLGMRIKNVEREWYRLQDAFEGPFLRTLCWTVRKAARLPDVLATPAFTHIDRLHLASKRPRTAIPRVLAAAATSQPQLTLLDLHDVPCTTEPLRRLPLLTHLAMRLTGTRKTTLPIQTLRIRARSAAELEVWRHVKTPNLRRLEVHLEGECPRGIALPLPALDAVLERPFDVLAIHRSLPSAYPRRFEILQRHRRIALPERPRLPKAPPAPLWSVVD